MSECVMFVADKEREHGHFRECTGFGDHVEIVIRFHSVCKKLINSGKVINPFGALHRLAGTVKRQSSGVGGEVFQSTRALTQRGNPECHFFGIERFDDR